MGASRGLGAFAPSAWPEPNGAAVTCKGVPKDISLAGFADRVDDFAITRSREGMLVARINGKDRKTARGLMSSISNQLPLLAAAAAVGIEKARFPKRMIDAAVIARFDSVIIITLDLTKDAALHNDTDDFLIHTLRARMREASERPSGAEPPRLGARLRPA